MRMVSIGECMVEFAGSDGGGWTRGFAGDTLNVAWAAHALGLGVGYVSRVGRDAVSDEMCAFLQAAGIATDHISRDAERTVGLYTIATDAQGERSFSYWREASAARNLAEDVDALGHACARADVLYLSGITLAILTRDARARLRGALAVARSAGARVAFDPNIRPRLWENPDVIREEVAAMAAGSDILLPTFEDEEAAFGDTTPQETAARYAALGVAEVVVKNGAAPTLFLAQGQAGEVPVAQPRKPIDTTGAGDSFSGAYLAERARGVDVARAIGIAQAVAGEVIIHRGALVAQDRLAEVAQAARG